MTYKGHVENGVIVLDDPVTLEEGVRVTVEVQSSKAADQTETDVTLADRYRPFIGVLDDMPEDWSENHDVYLREEYRK